MRRIFGFTLAVLVMGLMAGDAAMAQGGRGGRGGGMGGGFGANVLMLAQNASVQTELKMTDDQKTKVKEVADAAREAAGAGGRRGGGNGGGARGQGPTPEQIAEFQKRSDENAAKVYAVLDAGQTSRLKQIYIQQQGSRALTSNADVVKELSLTDEQKSALKTITDESAKKGRELFTGLGRGASEEDRTKANEQRAALTKETTTECMAVLTAAQKTKFDTLKGAEFKLEMPAGGGRRGRGNNNN